jgi:hypothetical protein
VSQDVGSLHPPTFITYIQVRQALDKRMRIPVPYACDWANLSHNTWRHTPADRNHNIHHRAKHRAHHQILFSLIITLIIIIFNSIFFFFFFLLLLLVVVVLRVY